MSDFKVSKEKISLFPHPNADSLEIGKVGANQVVVQKGLYNDGDEVVFAPEKSVLSGEIKESFEKMLSGSQKNRVRTVVLRGEQSCGIIIPKELCYEVINLNGKEIKRNIFHEFKLGEDVSQKLGIVKYEAPIPSSLRGEVKSLNLYSHQTIRHDCYQFSVYENQFTDGQRILITEKIHGSQMNVIYNLDKKEKIVTSKGLFGNGLKIEESDSNSYWIAAKNDRLFEKIEETYDSGVIQIIGELIPCQGGYTYGSNKKTCLIYDLVRDGISVPFDDVPEVFKKQWVPVLYDGPFIRENDKLAEHLRELRAGKETVSGKELHIREGVVIRPYIEKLARDGKRMRLKLINPKYKETGEEIN